MTALVKFPFSSIPFVKILVALAFAIGAAGITAAASADQSRRSDYCSVDHDHRGHNADYYDYYPKDRFYRAGPYRDSRASVTVRIGDRGYDNDSYGGRYDNDRYDNDRYDNDRYDDRSGDRRYGDRRYDNDRYDGRRGGGRVVQRRVYDTRFRARIILIEEEFYGGRGRNRVCTIDVRGPEARYVPRARLHNIADRDCSRFARVRFA